MWITIRRLCVESANAASNPAAVGSLPITGMHGAVQAALRAQGMNEPALGIIVRAHEISPRFVGDQGLGTGFLTTYQGRVNSDQGVIPSKVMSASNDPDPRMDFEISLAVELREGCDVERLALDLRKSTFCGGRMIRIGQARSMDDEDDMLDELQASGAGFVLVDRTAKLLERANEIGDSGFAALVDILAEDGVPPRRKMALGVGFRMLGDPKPKPESRNPEVRHAYAEPVLGYAELHPLWEAEECEMPFVWRPRIDRETGYCIVKGEKL